MQIIFLVVAALILSYWGVALIRRWALERQVLDIPNERSSHSTPTPRGGGLVIVVVTLLFVWFFYTWRGSSLAWWHLGAFTIGALTVATVGWIDDLHSLSSSLRLAFHGLSAACAMLACGYVSIVGMPFIGQLPLGWIGLPFTLLWIVGLTNAYNFMDGIDGLAGSQAVLAGLGWAVIAWFSKQPLIGVLGLLLAASSLGFLVHNWPPAHIFMGDVGSGFLGYTFAVMPLLYSLGAKDTFFSPQAPLAAVLFIWPFIFDASLTFIRRALKRENVFAAHRSHLYQRLVIAGWSHRAVTLVYVFLSFIGSCLSILWIQKDTMVFAISIWFLPVLALMLWFLVIRQEHRHGLH